jgi:hypothetical protein
VSTSSISTRRAGASIYSNKWTKYPSVIWVMIFTTKNLIKVVNRRPISNINCDLSASSKVLQSIFATPPWTNQCKTGLKWTSSVKCLPPKPSVIGAVLLRVQQQRAQMKHKWAFKKKFLPNCFRMSPPKTNTVLTADPNFRVNLIRFTFQ